MNYIEAVKLGSAISENELMSWELLSGIGVNFQWLFDNKTNDINIELDSRFSLTEYSTLLNMSMKLKLAIDS